MSDRHVVAYDPAEDGPLAHFTIREDGTVEQLVHDCGYPEDTFACRIRHQGQPIIKWGRASQQ